jgi:hypothetical protein
MARRKTKWLVSRATRSLTAVRPVGLMPCRRFSTILKRCGPFFRRLSDLRRAFWPVALKASASAPVDGDESRFGSPSRRATLVQVRTAIFSEAFRPIRLREITHECQSADLRQQRLRLAARFDKIEVTSFLLAVADDYESLRGTDRLRRDLSRMEAILHEHRERKKTSRAR